MMELNQRTNETMMEFKKTMMEFQDDDGIAYTPLAVCKVFALTSSKGINA